MDYRSFVTHRPHLDYLQSAVDRQSMPHAMLFWGPEGTGKLAAAVAFSSYLLCDEKQSDGPCNNCSSCIKTSKFIHPDVHFVFPTAGAKMRSTDLYPQWREALARNPYFGFSDWMNIIEGDNKQGNINSGDVHRIIEQLQLKSFEGGHKLLIMWMAEYLRKEGNKLLKLIEEPPEDTVIILIAEDRDAILPTILSRCQQLYFPPLKASMIAERAQEVLGIAADRAKWIAAASNGNWNQAVHLVEGTAFNPVDWMQEWIRAAWSADQGTISDWANQMGQHSREGQKQLIRYLLNIWQKLFWLKWGIDFEAEASEMQLVKFLNTKIEFNELEALVRQTEDDFKAIERNANPRMIWMQSTLNLRDALRMQHAAIRV